MTIAPVNETSSVLAEFCGGASNDVAMMIGIGLVKDSDAVFFQYLGEEQQPRALMMPTSGKPVTRFAQVKLSGISIAEDIGEFKSTKLNLFLESSQGRVVMLTSGLTTIWSQCVINGLMGLFNDSNIELPFTLDSWKGNSKMRPCFAAIRRNGQKIRDEHMYNQLADARADRDQEAVKRIMRDAVEILNHAVSGPQADITEVQVQEVSTEDDF